jgi:hypothetical protein
MRAHEALGKYGIRLIEHTNGQHGISNEDKKRAEGTIETHRCPWISQGGYSDEEARGGTLLQS